MQEARFSHEHGTRKTEVILSLKGQGAREVRRKLEDREQNVSLIDVGMAVPLRVVDAYRHLGVETTATGNRNKDLHSKMADARATTRALQRRVFNDRNMPTSAKVNVARACVWTRLLRMSGARERPSEGMSKKLHTEVMRPLRIIAGAHKPPKEGEKCKTNEEVRRELKTPHPEALLMAERLRLAARISRSGPSQLCVLLQGAGGEEWRRDLIKDMEVLKMMLGNTLSELPAPGREPAAWEQLWTRFPGQWKGLISKFLRTVAVTEKDFIGACARAGVMLTKCEDFDDSDDEWLCGSCNQVFRSFAVLMAHRAKMHGYRDPMRRKVTGSICPSCGADHRCRLRLRRHLYRSRVCGSLVAEMGDLDEEEVEQADLEEAKATKAAKEKGRFPEAGPPVLPV